MRRALLSAALAAAMLASPGVLARSSHHSGGSHHFSHASRSHHSGGYAPRSYPGVRRNAHGRIERSAGAKDAFRKANPCPATGKRHGACPGYVIDHVQALKHGGADAPYNMQWQTNAAAKAKDKWE